MSEDQNNNDQAMPGAAPASDDNGGQPMPAPEGDAAPAEGAESTEEKTQE